MSVFGAHSEDTPVCEHCALGRTLEVGPVLGEGVSSLRVCALINAFISDRCVLRRLTLQNYG